MTPPAVSMPDSQNTTRRTRTCGLSGNGCGATDVLWRITPIKQHLPDVCSSAAGGTVAGRKSPLAFRTSTPGAGDRMDCGPQSAGQRTDRATVRNAAGSLGKGNAPGRDRQPRSRESFFADAFSSGVGRAFHGGASQAAQCGLFFRDKLGSGLTGAF